MPLRPRSRAPVIGRFDIAKQIANALIRDQQHAFLGPLDERDRQLVRCLEVSAA